MQFKHREIFFRVVVLVLVVLVGGYAGSGYAQTPEDSPVVTIIVDLLNVRSGPGETFEATTQLNAGDQVTVVNYDEGTGWMEVRLADGQTGWVGVQFTNYASLDLTPTPAAEPPPAEQPPVALSPTPAPLPSDLQPSAQDGVAEITLEQLNVPSLEMHSPVDQAGLDFYLPYRWQLIGTEQQNVLTIQYDLHHAGIDPAGSEAQEQETMQEINPSLDIYINDELVYTFAPQVGTDLVERVPVPPKPFNDLETNKHRVRLAFKTSNCDNPGQTRLIVRETSFFHFEYRVLPMQLDLASFPRPLVQDLFTPESIVLILPDDYNDRDLSAAASLAATIGNRTSERDVAVDLITASQATPDVLANRSAVLVGKPSHNAFMLRLYQEGRLPTTLDPSTGQIAATGGMTITRKDGVIQLIASDVNADRAYLIVTGHTDDAVLRAARSLSIEQPGIGLSGNLGVVKEIDEVALQTAQFSGTISLADMGYYETPFYGVGTQRASVGVFVPANWRITRNPRLRIRYLHSSSLDPNVSSINVLLNDRPVGSAPLHPEHQGELQVEIELPMEDFETGQYNYLVFETVVELSAECMIPPEGSTWIRILDTTELRVPFVEENELRIPPSDAIALFASRQDLRDVWLSLPENPSPVEVQGAIHTAWMMGRSIAGQGFAPQVSRGMITTTHLLQPGGVAGGIGATQEEAPIQGDGGNGDASTLLPQYHIIAFGLPTTNPVIQMINDELPQPFEPDTTTLSQQVGDVVYRLPDGLNLGVVEFLLSPWNQRKAIAVVSGTTPEGVAWSVNAMTNDWLLGQLNGDVNFITGERVVAVNSRKLVEVPLADSVERSSREPVVQETVTPEPVRVITSTENLNKSYEPRTNERTGLMTAMIIGLVGTGVTIGLIGMVLTVRKIRKSKE